MISPFIVNIKAIRSEWPADRKSDHDEVDYTEPASMMGQDCGTTCGQCAHFIAPFRCMSVKDVTQIGWCRRFETAYA